MTRKARAKEGEVGAEDPKLNWTVQLADLLHMRTELHSLS